eukprot:COSAG03_NODE_15790_length_420_cov_0.956386_1_plen_21_part_01
MYVVPEGDARDRDWRASGALL